MEIWGYWLIETLNIFPQHENTHTQTHRNGERLSGNSHIYWKSSNFWKYLSGEAKHTQSALKCGKLFMENQGKCIIKSSNEHKF